MAGQGGAEGDAVVLRVGEGVGGVLVDAVEALVHPVFIGIGQDGLLAGEHLLHEAVHDAVGLGPAGVAGLGLLPHVYGIGNGDGHRHQGQGGKGQRDGDHHHQGAHHRDQAGKNLDDVGGHAGGDHVDVIADPADDVPGLMPVEIAHGQAHQLGENILAHLPGDPAADHGHAQADGEAQEGGTHIAGQHQQGIVLHGPEIDFALSRGGLPDGGACQVGSPQV